MGIDLTMKKNLTLLILSLSFCQFTKAQTWPTLLYYMKNHGDTVLDKNKADYFLYVLPKDTATQLYSILEQYPDGKKKLMGTSLSSKYNALKFPTGRSFQLRPKMS
jgi:hypothetical protein